TPHCFDAEPRGLDHGRAGASDADVEVRPCLSVETERFEDAIVEALSPIVDAVSAQLCELLVEVGALVLMLRRQLRNEHGNAVHRLSLGATAATDDPSVARSARPATPRADQLHGAYCDGATTSEGM